MAELLKEVFTYKVRTESQATDLIEQKKEELHGNVTYSVSLKTKRSKGEVIDTWYIVAITHDLTV